MLNSMAKQIAKLEDHYILCGAGRTGSHIIERFCETDIPFVVVEQSLEVLKDAQERVKELGKRFLYIQEDATEDETLEQAKISKAKGLIAALNDDKDNLFVILTARSLNSSIRIVARVNDEKYNKEKLEKAGADKVISTNAIGGLRMASEMIRPVVVDFLDQMVRTTEKEKTLRFTELPIAEITTPALKKLIDANRTLNRELWINDIGRHTGLLVVAIKAREEADDDDGSYENSSTGIKKRYRFTPRGDERLRHDDILVVIGTQEKLDEVRKA